MDTLVTPAATGEVADEQVIEQILSGEKDQFASLIRKYNARLYRIGMSIVHNDSEIEDLMQNAYIKAYQNLGRFEGRSRFSTWLVRIMVNECLQFLKKSKRNMSLDGIQNDQGESAGNNLKGDYRTPAHETINRELARTLEEALVALPEKYRLVFVMREMECMSIAETREALDISESNVKVRLNRAKAMLRTNLSKYYQSDSIFHFYLTRCERVTANVMARI